MQNPATTAMVTAVAALGIVSLGCGSVSDCRVISRGNGLEFHASISRTCLSDLSTNCGNNQCGIRALPLCHMREVESDRLGALELEFEVGTWGCEQRSLNGQVTVSTWEISYRPYLNGRSLRRDDFRFIGDLISWFTSYCRGGWTEQLNSLQSSYKRSPWIAF